MARGDVTLFEEFADGLGKEGHNLDTDTLKLGLINNNTTPTAGYTNPTWSSFSADEVNSVAGNYVADGVTLANTGWSEAAGVGTLAADDVAIAQDGSGFTDGYWGIIYNDSHVSKQAIGFVDLGGPVSEQDGPVNINWNASGVFIATVNP